MLHNFPVPHSCCIPSEIGLAVLAVNISSVWEAKMSDIRCHRTQLGESPILDASEARQRLFLGVEHFCLSASRSAADGKIFDILDWLEN